MFRIKLNKKEPDIISLLKPGDRVIIISNKHRKHNVSIGSIGIVERGYGYAANTDFIIIINKKDFTDHRNREDTQIIHRMDLSKIK